MTTTYKIGTVATTNGNATVVGTGTAWVVAAVAGGMFSCDGLSVPIASITDDTHLTLDYPWPGTTGTGKSYSIMRENSDASDIVDMHDKLAALLVTLSIAGIHPNSAGTLAQRNALSLNASNDGYLFLQAELGVAFAFYRWDGTALAWVGPFPVASATTAAAGVQSIVAGTNVTVDNTNPNAPVINATGTPMEQAIHAATAKGTPVDNDEFGIADSAASYGLKKLFWSALKTTMFTSWGSLIAAGTAKAVPVDADTFAFADSAASNATRIATLAQLRASIVKREVLTTNRVYYVRTDGNDANTGLVNSAGGAFLTLQKAINVVATLDLSIFNVTIQVGAGTYTAGCTIFGPFVGSGGVSIVGDTTTPSNVVISVTNANAIIAQNGAIINVGGFKLQGSGSGNGLYVTAGAKIVVNGKMEFGAFPTYHMYAEVNGRIQLNSVNYTISGGAIAHAVAIDFGSIYNVINTITLVGTPAFSTAFAMANRIGVVEMITNTFVGSATGARYNASLGGGVLTGSSNVNYFPGSSAGVVQTNGWYS